MGMYVNENVWLRLNVKLSLVMLAFRATCANLKCSGPISFSERRVMTVLWLANGTLSSLSDEGICHTICLFFS